MRIHIIGAGVVGVAVGRGCARFGHEVVYTDKGHDHQAVQADLTLICTPEAAVPKVVRELGGGKGAVAIRSSVPPGTTAQLESEIHLGLCHNPEFLREATAEADFLEAPLAIVGVPGYPNGSPLGDMWVTQDKLKELYLSMGKQVRVCNSTESELLKLLNNAHLASLISWWNEAAQMCRHLGVNSHHLARLMVENDPRISPYGALRHGAPYGGHCLPKDTEQLRALAEREGVNTLILDAVRKVNVQMMLKQE
jgi:UDPglucose 6-dehydrogenase